LFEIDITSTDWAELRPNSPFYFFVPRDEELRPEYEQGWKVTEIMREHNVGFVTARDKFLIDFDKSALTARIRKFRSAGVSSQELTECYGLKDTSSWSLEEARKALQVEADWETSFAKCLYRSFDIRHIYYSRLMLERPVYQIHRHMLAGENLGLVCCRQQSQVGEWALVGIADNIVESCYISNKTREINYLFPLYLYPAEGEMQFEEGHRRPNLNPEFIKVVSEKLGLKFIKDGKGDLKDTWGPEDIFNYAYAVFHSPTYRSRYAEFLKIDFPRLPLTSGLTLFRALCEKGAELVSWHLLTNPSLQMMRSQIKYDIKGSNLVEKVRYDDNLQRVYINKTQYFEGIAPDVWNFYIGGYHVCEKWLKDRKGRTLTYDDQSHYQDIAIAIKETIRLMTKIDAVVPGWPVT